MKTIPPLREKQVEQLAFYIGHPKCLDQSHAATGKTPPVCVYASWMWLKNEKKTVWAMPKSLLLKNKREMIRFTEFTEQDVVILDSDHAPMTKSWDGPTIDRVKKVATWIVEAQGVRTDTYSYQKELEDRGRKNIRFIYQSPSGWQRFGRAGKVAKLDTDIIVTPVNGPDGKPQKKLLPVSEKAKDMIAAAAGAKVFICTFAFLGEHWKRLTDTIPEIDLIMGDEIHMPGGWTTAGTKSTDAFLWMTRKCSRMVGMTGTLINGRLDTAFPVIHAIEPRYYSCIEDFRFQHGLITDDYGRVLVWRGEDKVKAILDRYSIQRTFEEVYGKEDVVFFTEIVQMNEDTRVEYDKFHEQAMLELENGDVLDGTLPGVSLIRARQIMAHPETMGLESDSGWTGKDDRLAIHLLEGQKTLIFASLVPEQERILKLAKSMGLRAELINGSVSAKERNRINDLAEGGALDVIVASGPTVSVGYNWECFDLVIFASIDYMDTNILQAYRRASRGTRTKTLRVVFLQYEDSIDQRVYGIVKKKSQLANRVDPSRPVLEFEETVNG